MPNNVIDLSKFEKFKSQLNDIQKVVDKLLTKQNADVYNKIGSKVELLFEAINQIDMKNAPVEEIRELIKLLKDLRETCVTLSSYKKYLESVLPNTINKLESIPSVPVESTPITPEPTQDNSLNNQPKVLEMVPQHQVNLINENAA